MINFLKFNIKIDFNKRYNVYGNPKTKLLYYIVRNDFLYKIYYNISKISNIMPKWSKNIMHKYLVTTEQQKPILTQEYLLLQKIFQNDIKLLSKLLNLDLSQVT